MHHRTMLCFSVRGHSIFRSRTSYIPRRRYTTALIAYSHSYYCRAVIEDASWINLSESNSNVQGLRVVQPGNLETWSNMGSTLQRKPHNELNGSDLTAVPASLGLFCLTLLSDVEPSFAFPLLVPYLVH